MALKVKAVERLLKFDKEKEGKYRYVLKPDLYTSLTQAKVIKEAALRSGVSRGVMQACWDAAGEVIKAWATEGHSVALPGLGTMRFGLRSKAVEKVEDVKTGLIESRRIIFTPDVDLKDELKNTAIQITCIDHIGDPDCTGRHVLYGILVKKDPNCMAVWIFFVTLPSKIAYPMITTLIIGLLIPLLGTMLGSAFVFFMRDEMSARLQNSLLGFASGVMIAASVWC